MSIRNSAAQTVETVDGEAEPDLLLEICIPSFNRATHLNKLLSQISAAVARSNSPQIVGVSVSNNNSTDETRDVLESWSTREPKWKLRTQETNIGMLPNFLFLVEHSHARYCWLLGDDDELEPDFRLDNLLSALEAHTPDLLIFSSAGDRQDFPKSCFFEQSLQFVRFVAKQDPDFLRRHTWIAANIFRREAFDLTFARTLQDSWYAHMYGIFRGIRNSSFGVYVEVERNVTPSQQPGAREANFPNLKLLRQEWASYFAFLALEFRTPKLWVFALRWRPDIRFQLLRFIRRFSKSRLSNILSGRSARP